MSAKTMTAIVAAVTLGFLGLPATPSFAVDGADATVVVSFDSAQAHPEQAASSVVADAGGTVTEARAITAKTVAVTISRATPTQAAQVSAEAEDSTGVKAVEVSRLAHPTSTNDTYYHYLWDLNDAAGGGYGVNAEDAWSTSTGNGAVVGVIDTGITSHSDLNQNVIPGYDFISDPTMAGDGGGWDSDPSDAGDYTNTEPSSWHGTHVAGTIAAIRNNAKGIVGVAPNASIEPIRVLGRGGGTEADIIAAVRWGAGLSVAGVPANPHPADVLNLSLGGLGTCSYGMQTAINAAVSAGTAVVVAAGNTGTVLSSTFPANCANVIRVTATTHEGTRASYSNYGTSSSPATISAPGGSGSSDPEMTGWIVSTVNGGTTTPTSESYTGMTGTSMAAPHVSAVLALIRAVRPSLSVADLTAAITSTTTPLSGGCSTTMCGPGVVNAPAALTKATGTTPLSLTVPTIAGVAIAGRQLSAAASASPAAATLSYQWLRNGQAIAGATGPSYLLNASDVSAAVSVQASAQYNTATVSKNSIAMMVGNGAFSMIAVPRISGTYKVGKKLKATAGAWSPAPATVSYQWYRGAKRIGGASASSYKLHKADRKKKVSVRIIINRPGYATAFASSASRKVR